MPVMVISDVRASREAIFRCRPGVEESVEYPLTDGYPSGIVRSTGLGEREGDSIVSSKSVEIGHNSLIDGGGWFFCFFIFFHTISRSWILSGSSSHRP